MSDADRLYRGLVVEHGKRPRNVGRLADATHAADGDNPLCGDALRVELRVDGERVAAVRFTGECCAIATASASLMTERLTGTTRDESARLAARMEQLCATGAGAAELGDLAAFADVHRHPVRVGCALLPWRTLRDALRT